MAYEKRLETIPPQLFTADGGSNGLITVTDAHEYKVKQEVYLTASTLPDLDQLEIKEVVNAGHGIRPTQIYVGPKKGSIDTRTDVSAYTVALGAAIVANKQLRPSIPNESINRAVYEEEPTVALRTILVDEMGNDYNDKNPFPIAATFDGDVKVGDIRITAVDNDPVLGDIHSSVRISDGNDEMEVNSDGSINVKTVKVTTPFIQNFNAPLANTEYSIVLPAKSQRFIIRARSGNPRIQLAYVAGQSDTVFTTIRPGTLYAESDIMLDLPTSLYFRVSKPNEIIEIISWS